MLCDKCGKKTATVYYKQVINGETHEEHLCEECAGDLMNFGGITSFGQLDLNKLFSGAAPKRSSRRCPGCGMTFAEYNSGDRLGCSRCYQTFEEELRPVIQRFHGGKRHMGKVKMIQPGVGNGLFLDNPELANQNYERLALQKQLSELIELEKFEEAAKVRDKIRALDEAMQSAVAKIGPAAHSTDKTNKTGKAGDAQ